MHTLESVHNKDSVLNCTFKHNKGNIVVSVGSFYRFSGVDGKLLVVKLEMLPARQ